MAKSGISRRIFLGMVTSAGVMTLAGCQPPTTCVKVAYRRSGRGMHVSNAAKKHNANRLYATYEAALADTPHTGDRSKIVMVNVNCATYDKLFPTGKVIADLRRDL